MSDKIRRNDSHSSIGFNSCGLNSCQEIAKLRCSRCKIVCYCCVDHQKKDWKSHKSHCISGSSSSSTNSVANKQQNATMENHNNYNNRSNNTLNYYDSTHCSNSANDTGNTSINTEKRSCRCMFCGVEHVFSSEEDAINHMRECPALQEQLAGKEAITIPTILKDKLPKSNNF